MHFNLLHRRHTPVYDPPSGPPPHPRYAPPDGPPPVVVTTHVPPPDYSHSDRVGHEFGALSDADSYECDAARVFCGTTTEQGGSNQVYDDSGNQAFQETARNPILPPENYTDMINKDISVWKMNLPERWHTYDELREFPRLRRTWWNNRFGTIKQGLKIKTTSTCPAFCFLSNLPLVAGLCPAGENLGVYYEIRNVRIGCNPDYSVAFGTACKPYPGWRFPGWNRLSVGLHLDDYRTFHANDEGGEDIDETNRYHFPSKGVRPKATDTFGCGIDFASRGVFFTYNGTRIQPDAYSGVYPSSISNYIAKSEDGLYDVFAAIGVQGETELEVNFGAKEFSWKEGNQAQWRIENHTSQSSPPPYTIS